MQTLLGYLASLMGYNSTENVRDSPKQKWKPNMTTIMKECNDSFRTPTTIGNRGYINALYNSFNLGRTKIPTTAQLDDFKKIVLQGKSGSNILLQLCKK
jgi:hypothetical protein